MSNEKYHQSLIVGATIAAGILGTLSALRRSNRSIKDWTDQAKDTAYQFLEKGEAVNKKMMLGGVAGGLIGAATALLLAPKAGSDLIKDLISPFFPQEKMKHSKSRQSPSSKSASHKKKSPTSRSTKGSSKLKAAKTNKHTTDHSSAEKKKSPVRKRTATAAIKQTTSAPEKAIKEETRE